MQKKKVPTRKELKKRMKEYNEYLESSQLAERKKDHRIPETLKHWTLEERKAQFYVYEERNRHILLQQLCGRSNPEKKYANP